MRSWLIGVTLLGCGGHHSPPQHYAEEIRLDPVVDGQQWYRAQTTCAQGPFELEVPATGARHGEDVELRLHTARAIALHAVVLVDDKQVDATDGVWDQGGSTSTAAQNIRCVADAKEKLLLGRAGGTGGGATGTVVPPGRLVVDPPPAQVQTPQLTVDTGFDGASIEVVKLHVPDHAGRIKIRFWSIEPNDLDGVLFGIAHIEWRPNVGEERYVAWLRENEERERRQAEEQRRAAEEYARLHPAKIVVVDVAAEEARERAEEARARLEAKKAEEARRRREIAAALELDRRRRRADFCAVHHEDRGCWGAGGYAMHAAFEQHDAEKAAYCAAHVEDARCWSEEEFGRRRTAWDARVAAATAPPPKPTGPPPAPLAEEVPPRLSVHAEWRAGYWDWLDGQWVWLAGMWRVPDEDIVAETTTLAPAAPPEIRVETPPPPPVRAAVWVGGFWQWNGSGWVWIAGSYQLRPEASATWRVPEWRPRGNMHVLIPGGWIRLGGGR